MIEGSSAPGLPKVKPLMRGMLHEAAFFVALVVGVLLVIYADGTRASTAAAIFAGSVALMLGASSLYHRVNWSVRVRPWMRRLDHAGIYLLIAGTYTPVGLLTLRGSMRDIVLGIVWGGAAAAIAMKFIWIGAPKWLSAVTGVALGWAGVAAMPQVARYAGATAVILLADRRPRIHRRRRRLRPSAAGSGAGDLRLPRALPCADARRRDVPVRRYCVLRR